MINYYKILAISPSATTDEVKEAYRKKALKYHPDVNDSPKAHSKFQGINEAYRTLIDPVSREKYDLVMEFGFAKIAEAIKREKAPKHKDPAYEPKSADFMSDYMARKGRPVKKDKETIWVENVSFAGMIIIGVAFFIFSCFDLMAEEWVEKLPGVAGMIASLIFLVLLAIGWKVVLGRKYKL